MEVVGCRSSGLGNLLAVLSGLQLQGIIAAVGITTG